jgi:cytochrome c5
MKKMIIGCLLVMLTGAFVISCTKKSHPATTSVNDTPPVPANATDIVAGEKIYTSSCGRCHDLKEPVQYTVAEWRPIMDKMAYKANLNTSEKINVLAYVIRNAKPAK